MDVKLVPKADMHAHLEGTISVDMVKQLAAKNGIPVPEGLISKDGLKFDWKESEDAKASLLAFVHAYDVACSVMKTAEDYTDITYDFLKRSAEENCIYAEVGISADHGAHLGLTYPQMVAAIEKGYLKAKGETGIEARFISTCVRHYGPEKALAAGKVTAAHPHPLVAGFGMAGDENAYAPADFAPAFDAAGLKRTAHAGEAAGPESIRAARQALGVKRFGHMVRAAEDDALVAELVGIGAVPEVCVSSNLCLKVFKDYKSHPLRKFFDAGLKVVLGSDDPTFFHTSIGREYQIAQDEFGFTTRELLRLTKNAIEEAFVDDNTRSALLGRLQAGF